jgi:8-amino-7-oxononanoate synthase
MSRYQQYEEDLTSLKTAENLRQLREGDCHGRHISAGGIALLNLSSNDYLGLAQDDELRREFLSALGDLRFSSSSSRLLTGNSSAHMALEKTLNDAFGRSSLLFNSGYHMNIGILPAVSNVRTLILSDELIHASMIDGIRLSHAQKAKFAHQDMVQLEQLVDRATSDSSIDRIIIVTESLYSMDGDMTDLSALVALRRRYPKVMLYVDEAHAVGVYGETGLGCAEQAGCLHEIDFLLGTFGKALASMGGYLVCAEVVRDFLINKSRSLIFSTALPPVNVAWSRFIFEHMRTLRAKREGLHRISKQMKDAILAKGFVCASDSHIVPVIYGDNRKTLAKAQELQRAGFHVMPIRPPSVPEQGSRLRLCLHAGLAWQELEPLLACL